MVELERRQSSSPTSLHTGLPRLTLVLRTQQLRPSSPSTSQTPRPPLSPSHFIPPPLPLHPSSSQHQPTPSKGRNKDGRYDEGINQSALYLSLSVSVSVSPLSRPRLPPMCIEAARVYRSVPPPRIGQRQRRNPKAFALTPQTCCQPRMMMSGRTRSHSSGDEAGTMEKQCGEDGDQYALSVSIVNIDNGHDSTPLSSLLTAA